MPQTPPRVLLLDHALKLAFGIACDLTRAETLEGLAVAYAEAGQATRAATILRRIWQMARGLPKPSDQTWQLRWLAGRLRHDIRQRLQQEKAQLLESMTTWQNRLHPHGRPPRQSIPWSSTRSGLPRASAVRKRQYRSLQYV
jgi:hypothetical protein